jgi:hypothetical protein
VGVDPVRLGVNDCSVVLELLDRAGYGLPRRQFRQLEIAFAVLPSRREPLLDSCAGSAAGGALLELTDPVTLAYQDLIRHVAG